MAFDCNTHGNKGHIVVNHKLVFTFWITSCIIHYYVSLVPMHHYENSCLWESHCFMIRTPKQLIYNYTTTKTWKYGQLKNIMTCQKINKLYYSYNLVSNGTPIWSNVHIVNTIVVNDVWLFDKLHFSCMRQLHYN
jgi:hypothetical protein